MIRIKDICTYLDKINLTYFFYGNEDDAIKGFSSLVNYKDGTVTWCKNKNYLPLSMKDYSLVIVGREDDSG